MKKIYHSPVVTIVHLNNKQTILTQSNSITSDLGIGFGGMSGGSIEPEVKKFDFGALEDAWSE
ncbi:MAG: hypothetical protein J5545_03120 [Bacteroidaceae bacterium]|nr:hypothetical protein [Bacteroidaceae bacterium]